MDDLRIDIEETSRRIGILAAWASGLIVFWKKGVKPVIMQVQCFKEMLSKLDKVILELTPNGGGSLRDAVNRIESRQIISDRRSKAFLLDTEVGIWESDVNGRCIWYNRTLENMLGRTPEGYNWLLSVCPTQREKVQKEWENAVINKREYEADVTYLTPENKKTIVRAKGYPLIDQQNEVCGWYGIATRKKEKER